MATLHSLDRWTEATTRQNMRLFWTPFTFEMFNLDEAPLMLLVGCSESESEGDLFAHLRARYDVRLDDTNFGPQYKIGPAFICRGQKFAQIKTFAGSLIWRITADARLGNFDKAVIFRRNSGDHFRLLTPDGTEAELRDEEIIPVVQKS